MDPDYGGGGSVTELGSGDVFLSLALRNMVEDK